jgi:hypothetical protein
MTSPMATLTAPTLLSLDEQVVVLRQGIECGDATLGRSMASDLREAPWERGNPPQKGATGPGPPPSADRR